MHAQDGRLWGVDDGCAKQGAKDAAVADGEGASVHVFNSELIITSLRHKTQRILSFVVLEVKSDGFSSKWHCSLENQIRRSRHKVLTFSPSALMAFSMSVKFMVSTLRITGTTSP